MQNITSTLRTFVVDNYLFGRTGGFSDDTSFMQTRMVNSTGILELVLFIEQTYGIQVGDEDLLPENLDSINRLRTFIERKRTGKAASAD